MFENNPDFKDSATKEGIKEEVNDVEIEEVHSAYNDPLHEMNTFNSSKSIKSNPTYIFEYIR